MISCFSAVYERYLKLHGSMDEVFQLKRDLGIARQECNLYKKTVAVLHSELADLKLQLDNARRRQDPLKSTFTDWDKGKKQLIPNEFSLF